MLKKINPDYYSPAFYTPHPGSDLYTYCIKNDLSLITDHNGYRRNPTKIKIKGHDEKFLKWALAESMRRTFPNQIKWIATHGWKYYALPQKIVRKIQRLVRRMC
ncbi:MAG: hypothetical protein ACMUIP_16965 [bacterium]